MSTEDQDGAPTIGVDVTSVAPTPEEVETARSYEAFEARAKELHAEPAPLADPVDEAIPGADAPDAAASSTDGGPETSDATAAAGELRESAIGVARSLAGLHLATTDVAARTLGGLVERAGGASGNERVAGLARTQAGLLRRAAGRYTSLGRRLLG
jgi:hypothetical protein